MRNNLKEIIKADTNSNKLQINKMDKNMTQNTLNSKMSTEHMDYLKKKLENNKPKRIKISLYPNGEETKNNYSYFESKPALNDQMNLNKSFSKSTKLSSIKSSNHSFSINNKKNNDNSGTEFLSNNNIEGIKNLKKTTYKVKDETENGKRDRKYSFQLNSNLSKKEIVYKESRFKRNSVQNPEIKPITKMLTEKHINNKKFRKYQNVIDNKITKRKEKIKKEEDDDEDWGWNIDQFNGYRKQTMDIGLRKKFKNKLNSEFSKLEYVKLCKAISIAGKGENGLKKTNQDTYICERNINGILNFNIFGVLDGHGENGHFVSQFVSKYIINRIKNHPLIKNLDNTKKIYLELKSNGYQVIASIFTDADAQVAKEKFDCLRSGTTCVVVIQLDEHIICANVGDSRAIMIFDDIDNDNLKYSKIYPLSYDCKPENPMERLRINKCGGSIEQMLDENDQGIGPFRVFIKGQENPGLAMSRSIGDIEAKTIGVIPNPQIIEYELSSKSKYMIACSDGIWEFISNEEAMEIGKKYYLRNDPLGLCNELKSKATKIWMKEDIFVDDITVVVVFF